MRDLRKGFVVGVVERRETLAARRRRESRREEFAEQARLVEMLAELLDPRFAVVTALENRPRSRWSGFWAKARGVRAGIPDLMIVVYWKPPVFIEMKSKGGVPSKTQRRVFADLQAMGAAVYVARSADAALEALRRHIPFRREWKPASPLQPWEGPFEFTDSRMRLPQHPEVRAERAAALKQWRQRQRERKAQQPMGVSG
jgi:hypothetical protein